MVKIDIQEKETATSKRAWHLTFKLGITTGHQLWKSEVP